MGSRDVGKVGESVACQYLERKGFTILERNFSRPFGEIDIIAELDGVVHFVEVKSVTREPRTELVRGKNEHLPEEMAHEQKIRKVARLAHFYMAMLHDKRNFQIDVIAIELVPEHKKATCRLYSQVL